MLSLEIISAVKVASNVCHIPKVKLVILDALDNDLIMNLRSSARKKWEKTVKDKTLIIISLDLPKNLMEKVIYFVIGIASSMLYWAVYHEKMIGFSREYSTKFLSSSFFSSRGIIERKVAAKELINDKTLDIKQRYVLACVYCFTKDIHTLFNEMTCVDKEMFYDAETPEGILQPEMIKYWSYYEMGEIKKITDKDPVQYILKEAIKYGNKAAVQYCFEEVNIIRIKDDIVESALNAIRFWQKNEMLDSDETFDRNEIAPKDFIPQEYFADVVCYLLSKMKENEKIEFLKKDMRDDIDKKKFLITKKYSRVLLCLLHNSLYQDYFLKTIALMWEFLPKWFYFVLLLMISTIRETVSGEHCNENWCQCRNFFREFWCQSHECYKRYVLSNQELPFRCISNKAATSLLFNILSLSKFTDEDRQNIQLIVTSASEQEKENIIYSEERRYFYIKLIQEEKWDVLNRIELYCFKTKEDSIKFKKELCFTKEVQQAFINFIKNEWRTAETFIKWASLTEESLIEFKKKIISSEYGMCACIDLISDSTKMKAGEVLIRWCLSSEEEIKLFKKELIFSWRGIYKCETLMRLDKLEDVNELVNFCLSSEEDIKEFKKKVAYDLGSSLCETFIISGYAIDYADQHDSWKVVEKFLTWCFSSEEEIKDFKKNNLIVEVGTDILYNFIESYQYEKAERFFAWLDLSEKEVIDLKKDTLFNHSGARMMLMEMMFSEEDDAQFIDCESKDDAIELLLRWYLNDKDTVIEFKDIFKLWCEDISTDEIVLKKVDYLIEQLLSSLNQN